MRKNYQKPEITVYDVEPRVIMAGSNNIGGDYANGELSKENNSEGLW